jgi:putative redox protein
MTTPPAPRRVTVERTSPGRFTALNERGGRVAFGKGDGDDFTPTELLLAGIGGCTAIDVDILTSRRADAQSFTVSVDANKIRDDEGNRLTDILVTFRVRFPDGPDGDAAREVLPEAVQRSHDRICTVGRTVELGTPIATRIE